MYIWSVVDDLHTHLFTYSCGVLWQDVYANVVFPQHVRVPKPTVTGKFYSASYDISSGKNTVIDVNTIRIKWFACRHCSNTRPFYRNL